MHDPSPLAGAPPTPVPAVPTPFSAAALAGARRVLQLQREGAAAEPALRVALADAGCLLAGDAHAHALAAERMVVALKTVWGTLDESHALSRAASHALLDRVVSAAIRAYYAA